jgi:predicted nucleic acid-binding protein
MIAGTAIALGAPLATNNVADFSIFLEHGLELVK